MMEIIAILDVSGSMSPLTSATISGYNSYISELRSAKQNVSVTLVLFNTSTHIVYEHKAINEVPLLTTETYRPSGGTALRDALGTAIFRHSKFIEKMIEKPSTIFFVTTDGEENSSFEYSQTQIKEMVTKAQEIDKWTFIFAASNIDGFAAGESYGFRKEDTASIGNDTHGQSKFYSAAAQRTIRDLQKEHADKNRTFQEDYDKV